MENEHVSVLTKAAKPSSAICLLRDPGQVIELLCPLLFSSVKE